MTGATTRNRARVARERIDLTKRKSSTNNLPSISIPTLERCSIDINNDEQKLSSQRNASAGNTQQICTTCNENPASIECRTCKQYCCITCDKGANKQKCVKNHERYIFSADYIKCSYCSWNEPRRYIALNV